MSPFQTITFPEAFGLAVIGVLLSIGLAGLAQLLLGGRSKQDRGKHFYAADDHGEHHSEQGYIDSLNQN